MGGVVKKAKKLVRKAIPKEIKPALPYIAAYYGGPLLAGKSTFLTPAVSKALIAGTTSAVVDEQGDPLRAAALAAAPDVIQSGLGNIGAKLGSTSIADPAMAGEFTRQRGVIEQLGNLATKASESDLMTSLVSPKGQTLGAQAKALAIPTAIEGSAQLAQIQQDQIDEYNRQLQEQGVMNKVKRRQGIFNIYMNAGYDADYVNSVLDKYGYADGGIAYLAEGGSLMDMSEEVLRNLSRGYRGATKPLTAMFSKKKKDKEPKVVETEKGEIVINFPEQDDDQGFRDALMTAREGIEMAYKTPGPKPTPMMQFAKGGEVEEGIMSKIVDSMGDDYDYFTRINIRKNLKQGETVEDAADLAEEEAMERVRKKYGFAKGGEVEEEEVSESGIMTVASAPNNFAELNMLAIDLFGRPYDQLSDGEQETLMDFIGSKSQAGGEGIMQMASGYKSDIEEMYEQYVFEMEEQGLQPMSFSQFLAQARSGMAKGGMMKGPDWFTNRVEQLMYQGLSYEEASEQAYNEGHGGYKKGGDVMSAEEYFKEKGKQEKLNNMERMRREYEEYKYKKKYGPRNEAKDGGIMEKDMRGGGFIPEGSKERADDVPARLSKNEFVMTADAVRAAGGGSVNKGAKKMYDLMYSLEGKI